MLKLCQASSRLIEFFNFRDVPGFFFSSSYVFTWSFYLLISGEFFYFNCVLFTSWVKALGISPSCVSHQTRVPSAHMQVTESDRCWKWSLRSPTPLCPLPTSPQLWTPLWVVAPPVPGQSVPRHHCSLGEEIFPNVWAEPCPVQLKAIASGPVAVTWREETNPLTLLQQLWRAIRSLLSLPFSRLNNYSSFSHSS